MKEKTANCLPTFYISKAKFNLCLTVNYGPERSIFEWENCNNNGKAQRWVKVSSRERPGMIQICYVNGQNKCLIASNQTNEEIKELCPARKLSEHCKSQHSSALEMEQSIT